MALIELMRDLDARIDASDLEGLLSLLGLLHVLAARCSWKIRHARGDGVTVAKPTHDRDLTVRQAVEAYPLISRTWLYERGEELGILCRPPGRRGPVVVEARLRLYLEHGVTSGATTTGALPQGRRVVGEPVRRRQAVPPQHGRNGREPK